MRFSCLVSPSTSGVPLCNRPACEKANTAFQIMLSSDSFLPQYIALYMQVVSRDQPVHLEGGEKGGQGFLEERASIAVFPVSNLTFKSLNMMKPSPQSHGFIYENQTPSAITDQEQQPSGRGYQGRTGKAINCQSLHRSTSPSTTTTRSLHPPTTTTTPSPHSPAHRHTSIVQQLFTVQRAHTHIYRHMLTTLHKSLSFCAPVPHDG